MPRTANRASRGVWFREAGDNGRQRRLQLDKALLPHERKALANWHWECWGRDAQHPPPGDWRVWFICAGRGFGKTRAGAEWVRNIARHDGSARIALVAASLPEARAVMVEGESGVLGASPGALQPEYEPSLRRITWPNGAQAFLYSAAEPESLRGPQHSHAWCDEAGKWDNAGARAMAAWDNLQMGMRLGEMPRILATSTPRSVPLIRRLMDEADNGGVILARGQTSDNAAGLPSAFLDTMMAQYGDSALGRQELEGELLTDVEGALWTRGLLEACRVQAHPQPLPQAGGGRDLASISEPSRSGVGSSPHYKRIVIGVDPPASAKGDACGIIVAALTSDGEGRVLHDASVTSPTPEQWARAVAVTAREWKADRVVAEANQGGDMVASVLRAADCVMPVKLVHASRGKVARAEPVAALYEAGRVAHVGMLPELEDQMCGMLTGGGYEGPSRSPDRADALVWALTELMLEKPRSVPRVRGL